MRNLKIDFRQEIGVLSLKSEKQPDVTNDVMFAYMHAKINILLSFYKHFFFLFLFFAKCKEYIFAVQLIYIQICPDFLPISK